MTQNTDSAKTTPEEFQELSFLEDEVIEIIDRSTLELENFLKSRSTNLKDARNCTFSALAGYCVIISKIIKTGLGLGADQEQVLQLTSESIRQSLELILEEEEGNQD